MVTVTCWGTGSSSLPVAGRDFPAHGQQAWPRGGVADGMGTVLEPL